MVIPALLMLGAVLLGSGVVLDAPAPSWIALGLAVVVAGLCLASPEPGAATEPDFAEPEEPAAAEGPEVVDDVWVIDGRRRFHTADCPVLVGQSGDAYRPEAARAAGFSPCSRCARDGARAATGSREAAQ